MVKKIVKRIYSMYRKNAKTLPRRSIAIALSVSILVSVFFAGGLFNSLAINPMKVSGLNRSVPVQQINLMPTDADTVYKDTNGNITGHSRTTLQASDNGKDSHKYSKIVVNDDGSVDFQATKDTWHSNNTSHTSTSYVEGVTLIGQKINLAENPWLMTRWSGSGRVNGRIYISVTVNGTEYGKGGTVLTNNAAVKDFKSKFGTDETKDSTPAKEVAQNLVSSGNLIMLTLSNMIKDNDPNYKYTNPTETDFNAGSEWDWTIDLYEYITKNRNNDAIGLGNTWLIGDEWKDSSKNYITVYMSSLMLVSETGKQLTAGTNTHWEQFALGREVLERPASMLPRTSEFIDVTDTSKEAKSVDYGRVSESVDGSVTFSNTSSTDPVKFSWQLRRYFNVTELESLHVEATFTGMSIEDDNFNINNWFGGRVATTMNSSQTNYTYRGADVGLKRLLEAYSRSKEVTDNSLTAVIDFHTFCKSITDDKKNYEKGYESFFPDDSLIYIADLKLTLPAGAKITFTRLEFQVENEEIPATKSNTAYPWYSNNLPDSLPPVGTPTYSTALNGATGRSYDWATAPENAPIVEQKVDMLAMKTFNFNTWNQLQLKNADQETVANPLFERYADGSSVYTNISDDAQLKAALKKAAQEEEKKAKPQFTTADYKAAYGENDEISEINAYYTLMRYGTTTENNWERNYYIYLDMDEVPYLYYSYEIMKEDENSDIEPQAGFYFHVNNARLEKFSATSSSSKWCYQYYLDHSGIGLNECSSVYALGANNDYFEYGTKAILSPTKARTGCIDISSLYVEGESDTIKNGEYLQLEALRIYLGPNTKIKINYFFFGSESLATSVKGNAFPLTAGDAYPWSVSKETFDAATDPDSPTATYTFANKIDLIADLQDRADLNEAMLSGKVNYDNGYPWDGADVVVEEVEKDGKKVLQPVKDANGNTIPKGYVTGNANTAVNVTVTDTTDLNYGYRFKAGTSFDYLLRLDIDTTKLESIRYLNYSVEAPNGMRWAIMFSEPNDGSMRRAITTWCDSDAKWGSDEDIQTSAPAGKTYFRMSTSGGYAGPNAASNAVSEYDTYWANHNNSSWRLYAIPGSQTGCIDLTQVTSDFSWNNGIVSVYLVAYRDPTFTGKQSYGSNTTAADPTVTFHYAYLTSSPIEVSNVGKGVGTPGTVYNWGGAEVTAPDVDQTIDFTFGSAVKATGNLIDYYPHGMIDLLDNSNVTFEMSENASNGTVEFDNARKSLKVTSSGEIAFNYVFNNPIKFNADTLKNLEFGIQSNAPCRIAIQVYDGNGKDDWVYLTKNNFSSLPSNYTLTKSDGTKDSNFLSAVTSKNTYTLSMMSVLFGKTNPILKNKSNSYIKKISIRFLGQKRSSGSEGVLEINPLQVRNIDVTIADSPYLYYSYRVIDKTTGKTVTVNKRTDNDGNEIEMTEPLRVSMAAFENGTYYYFRTMTGYDSAGTNTVDHYVNTPNVPNDEKQEYAGLITGDVIGYGKASTVRLATSDKKSYGKNHGKTPNYMYGSETGCIDLSRYFINLNGTALNQVRFYLDSRYYDPARHELVVDYLFLSNEKQSTTLTSYTTDNDFSTSKASKPADYQLHVVNQHVKPEAGTTTISPALKVDLDKTPYLFYSIKYTGDTKGTFGLTYNDGGSNSVSFHRDVGRKDGCLVSKGTSPTQYIQQSETGCIDVRSWNKAEGLKSTNVIYVTSLNMYNTGAEIIYMYFGALADKTIDLLPKYNTGNLGTGLPTRTWVNQGGTANAEYDKTGTPIASSKPSSGSLTPSTVVDFKGGDITGDGFNDLWYSNKNGLWSQIYLSYGSINNRGARSNGDSSDFAYRSTGNNQMSGLMIDLNETPYLHFSIEQPENSRTSFLMQLNDWSSTQSMLGKSAGEVKPWLSMYSPTSPAGQLINIVSNSYLITYYKDEIMESNPNVMVSGNHGGVIDLRSWFTVTNGCNNVINLDSIRFYTHTANSKEGYIASNVKVNYFYLSSSSSAAFSVTFHKNDKVEVDSATGVTTYGDSYTQYVLQNANEQYISDTAVESYKTRDENGDGISDYTFVGWYTDPECEHYFDIEGTPMTDNIDLYARWIDNATIEKDDVENGIDISEVNLLTSMDLSKKNVIQGNGTLSLDNEALSVKSTDSSKDFIVEIPVNKSYSVSDLRSLFMGFDNNLTCAGFDITLNAKSTTSRSYSLIQDAFYHTYLTDDKLLTAAPHDGESAFYTYLGVRDDLPVRENSNGLIEVKSITLTIPKGVSAEIRYIKAGNEMALLGNPDHLAPQSSLKDQTFDLLKNTSNDPSFVITSTDIVYNELASKSMTYSGIEYTQVAIHGREDGFAHIGGLYDYSIDMTISAADNPGRWLQFSIDQSTDSHFTFALYASFSGMVEGKNTGTRDVAVYDVHTEKSVSYFDSTLNDGKGGLVIKDLDADSTTFIPADSAYINGSKTYWVDLYSWYKDALTPYRSNSEVQEVKILGLRLFTDSRTTDTTINYMFIGSDEGSDSTSHFTCFAEYPYRAGAGASNKPADNDVSDSYHFLGHYPKGKTFHVNLDELEYIKDDAPIDDPTKKFVGWVFRDYAVAQFRSQYQKENPSWSYQQADAEAKKPKTDTELMPYLVYWNPNATNGRMYDADKNPGGSWSVKAVDGFVTDQKTIFYTFTNDTVNTQVIMPVFTDADYEPTLTVTASGGTVSMLSTDVTSAGTNKWTATYGTEVVVRASGNNFAGWYDAHGVLLSLSKDYRLNLMADTELTAKFGTLGSDKVLEYTPKNGRTIVWLQSETGTAGSDFKLESLSGGNILLANGTSTVTVDKSNINDLSGNKQIACYWNIQDGQLLKAIAPDGYHWEQLLSDGSSVRVSDGREYTFIASTNIKLVAKQGTGDFKTSVLIDEFAFDDDRTDPILRFNGQVICAENEELVSCGLTFIDFNNHGEIPSIYCGASNTVTATAWNSTTGQFVVEFSLEDSPEYVIRGYAIVRNTETDEYFVRYSECTATVF